MTNLEAALQYQAKGYSVIPVNPSSDEEIGKKPYIGWTEFQTRRATPEEIKVWWKKWPNAMIAVVTGKVSGMMTVDADTQEAIEKAEELIPDSLIVPTCTTPRGGRHYDFRYRNGFRNSNDGLLHVRGEGGYVVMPPSSRDDGRAYAWVDGTMQADLPDAPASLIEYINAVSLSFLYRERVDISQQASTMSTSVHNLFKKGNRDDGLFHVANSLVKGNANPEYLSYVMELLGKNCDPPFSEKELQEKIKSAINRAERKERNLAAEVEEWVLSEEMSTSVVFLSTDIEKCLQLSTREDKKNLSIILKRLIVRGVIEKHGDKRGTFRIKSQVENEINWETCDDTIVDVSWPFGLEQFYICLPKNIIVVAGSPDAGKTAFCLNFASLNMDRYQIKYFSSEMGALELKSRLKKFDFSLSKWKRVKFIERSLNFADVIDPDGINVVDYIEVPEEAWKIATPINEIFRKLDKGICLIALQKPKSRDVARGGESTLDRPRMYLSMGNHEIKIVKCKNWASEVNPNGLSLEYKIAQGCKFTQQSEWSLKWEEMRK